MQRIPLKWKNMEFDCCAFCECEEYLEGPHGAGSINFKCKGCGATYNDMGRLGVQLIGWPDVKPSALRF